MANTTHTLAALPKGKEAVITGFADDTLALKLMEMGCLPGEKIILQHIAPLGCPCAFEVNGTLVSLRKSEAQFVFINT
ncbi:MAG: ferrous iron transport protein A [Bacteroidetes bacterium]|nr:ferrous iron transport protein A [Bacteroidota bacterium]